MLNNQESPRFEPNAKNPLPNQPSLPGLSHTYHQRPNWNWIASDEKLPSESPDNKKGNNDEDKAGRATPKLPRWMHTLIRSMKLNKEEEKKKKPRE